MKYSQVVIPATGGGLVAAASLAGAGDLWILATIGIMLVATIWGFIKLVRGERQLGGYPSKRN